jgi:hypothetical protein
MPVEYAWGLSALYSALLLFIYWLRFKWGKWKTIDLVDPSPLETKLEEVE